MFTIVYARYSCRRYALTALLLSLCAVSAAAQVLSETVQNSASTEAVPRLIRFNGVVNVPPSTSSSLPVPDKIELNFSLYNQQAGGEALWTEQQTVKIDATGHYNAFLGAGSAAGIPVEAFSSGDARWLGIRAAGSPEQRRILLATVPYAFKAHDAETLAGHAASDFVTTQALHSALQSQGAGSGSTTAGTTAAKIPIANVTPTGSGTPGYLPLWTSSAVLGNSLLFQSGTHIGLGTATPGSPLEISASHNGQTTLLKLQNRTGFLNSTADIDFSDTSSNATFARIGAIRTNYNYAGDTDLLFDTYSNSVLNESMRITSYGWVGIGITTPHALLEAAAPTVTQGFGAYAITGVGGTATGGGIGGGIGVVGYGGGGTGYFQYADGSGGEFIGGNAAHEGDGLIAIAGSGYAGYFSGNVAASGTFTAGVVNNNVDHPLHPADQLLVHSAVGSSEMLNIYTGNVTTDAQGYATVQMPSWFESFNTDCRYQLTAIGQFAQVIIAQKLQNNAFRIRSSVPNLEVSWQVSAVRHDAYAQAHPLVVEQQKPAGQQGYYLHPELYGAGEDRSLATARHPAMMKQVKATREQQRLNRAAALHPSDPAK